MQTTFANKYISTLVQLHTRPLIPLSVTVLVSHVISS